MMASITGWKWRWPNITAPSITSSLSSFASDSTINTASCVPATTRSSWLSAISSMSGLSTYSLLTKPTRGAERAHGGCARERQRGRGRDHRQNIGIVLEIVRQRRHDHLGLVAPALGEQRPHRAIDQPRDQRFLLRRAAFALEIAAGDAACGVEFLLIVDGERQKVDAFPRLLGGDHRRQHLGLAIAGDHRAIGLARDLTGL